jgi:hypothetical protein
MRHAPHIARLGPVGCCCPALSFFFPSTTSRSRLEKQRSLFAWREDFGVRDETGLVSDRDRDRDCDRSPTILFWSEGKSYISLQQVLHTSRSARYNVSANYNISGQTTTYIHVSLEIIGNCNIARPARASPPYIHTYQTALDCKLAFCSPSVSWSP